MKKILALLLAVVMVLGMVACASKNETPAETTTTEPAATETTEETKTETAKSDKDYEIVVVPKDASNPWFVRMDTASRNTPQKLG